MILKERTIPKTEAERDPEKESSPKCWERPCERRHRGLWDWEERLGKSEPGQLGILCASCWETWHWGTIYKAAQPWILFPGAAACRPSQWEDRGAVGEHRGELEDSSSHGKKEGKVPRSRAGSGAVLSWKGLLLLRIHAAL